MVSPLGKIKSKIRDRLILYRYIYPFLKKNEQRIISKKNTLCLFCHPRGGSTWLAEILLTIPNSVLIDEPLWRGEIKIPFNKPEYFDRKSAQIAELNFFYNQYIPPEVTWPDAKNALKTIVSGRAISIGMYDEQNLKNLMSGDLYITKFNYANLLMPWLIHQFNFQSILLTRHPCAVISSQLRFPSWRNMVIPEMIEIEDFPYNEFYHAALKKVGKIDSREKYLALIWALGFKNTAMHKWNNKKWLTVSYEGLVDNYSNEINRINHRFGFDLQHLNIDCKKPSRSTHQDSIKYLKNNEQITAWQNELTQKQKAIIHKVLEIFEIDIYNKNAEPDYSRLYANEPIR